MAKKQPHIVVTFHTTAQALGFESFAKSLGLEGRLAPIPRQLSAGCGFAWLALTEDLPSTVIRFEDALERYSLGFESLQQIYL